MFPFLSWTSGHVCTVTLSGIGTMWCDNSPTWKHPNAWHRGRFRGENWCPAEFLNELYKCLGVEELKAGIPMPSPSRPNMYRISFLANTFQLAHSGQPCSSCSISFHAQQSFSDAVLKKVLRNPTHFWDLNVFFCSLGHHKSQLFSPFIAAKKHMAGMRITSFGTSTAIRVGWRKIRA